MPLSKTTLVSKPATSKVFRWLFLHLLRERFGFISDAQLGPIADIQFTARQESYNHLWPDALWRVIQLPDNIPVGYVVVNCAQSETRIIDLFVRQRFRGQGIATRVLMEIIQQGYENNLSCVLTVGIDNPAIALYKRLNFIEITRTETDILMETAVAKVQ
jgi:ribosomal protein S18 acetylase RimI-like enzyme